MSTEINGWFKSSYSGDETACVETTTALLSEGKVPVRDSKDVTQQHLTFSAAAFSAFVGDVKAGRYDSAMS